MEGRVPFLDKEFLDVAMQLDPEIKMAPGKVIEKKVLREAFADMLPSGIAWRQKEQFSDGVGYSWIDTLKEITATAVSDEQMAHAAERFPIHTPMNKEEYYYRSIFEEQRTQYPQRSLFDSRGTGMGHRVQEPERSQRTCRKRSTRRSILKRV